jgi:hypothetical protein
MVGQLCSVAAVADQQIVLIPLFLKYWTGETLSAWLTIFAAGNLVLAADAGLAWRSARQFDTCCQDPASSIF